MWNTIGLYLVKAAVWAYGHPKEVEAAIEIIKKAKQ